MEEGLLVLCVRRFVAFALLLLSLSLHPPPLRPHSLKFRPLIHDSLRVQSEALFLPVPAGVALVPGYTLHQRLGVQTVDGQGEGVSGIQTGGHFRGGGEGWGGIGRIEGRGRGFIECFYNVERWVLCFIII